MRRNILSALALALAFALLGNAPAYAQAAGGDQAAAGRQQESLAEAAKKARERKKEAPKTVKVFTNDNISQPGEISLVGGAAPAPAKEAAEAAAGEKEEKKDEAYWRGRFSALRTKLSQAEKELNILQRELGVSEVQYYDDPNKALREQLLRSDINKNVKKIQDRKTEIQQLKQQLSDLEDELRRAGGNPGWAR